MEQPNVFMLSIVDKQSYLWRRLKHYLETENDKDRVRNDNSTLSFEETQTIRARIAVRKSLLNLDI